MTASTSGCVSHDRKQMEAAVASALPNGRKAYFFDPLLLWHLNGSCYGVFGGASQALAWQRGASAAEREYFYLTNVKGERVTEGIGRPVWPHMLRHTFATTLLGDGFTISEVQRLMRHADLRTTAVYLEVRDVDLHAKIRARG